MRGNLATSTALAVILLVGLSLSAAAQEVTKPGVVTTTADLEYNLDKVRAGAPVPYLVAGEIPDDLRDLKYSVARKDAFFKTVLPLILSVNDDILVTRAYLLKINRIVAEGGHLDSRQKSWLQRLAEYYDVNPGPDGSLDLGKLIPRVDVIPPSLAMAQGAEESGFGTSRFAAQGNALFGELTRDAAAGMTTKAPELRGTGYLVRAFWDIRSSISAYERNLNTHPSYQKFRDLRADMRLRHETLDSTELATALEPYCGCGTDYITKLQNHIRDNALTDFDDAILRAADGN